MKDITREGNNNEVEMDYASVECRCKKTKGGLIGDFSIEELKEKFEGLLNRLDPGKHPTEPLGPAREEQTVKSVAV